jgi:hypothetical protein
VAAPPQGRHGEEIYHFPDTPSLGPKGDAWVVCGERNRIRGKFFGKVGRHFLSSDPKYGEWADFTFFSDGTKPISPIGNEVGKLLGGYIAVTKRKEGGDRGDNINLKVHQAVALLFGAPKKTAYPMSELLVIDHIVEREKTNFNINNLQILSGLQNLAKASNIKEVKKGNGAVLLLDGDAAGNGWYGELVPLYAFPDTASLGPYHDAWFDYDEREYLGITYRSFKSTNRLNGIWSDFGFPSDGSAPYNFKSRRFSEKTTTTEGYRHVVLAPINGSKTTRQFKNHVAVAYLWGAPKNTAMPMSLLLVVDHIQEGEKGNFRLNNLQIVTQMQNAQKGNGVEED